MQIAEVLYQSKQLKQLAGMLETEFNVKSRRYTPVPPSFSDGRKEQLPPNTIFLGMSNSHECAINFSSDPIVVVDLHSDMYSCLISRFFGEITNANWIYWALKRKREVHLVVPIMGHLTRPNYFDIPAGCENYFNLYSPDASKPSQNCTVIKGLWSSRNCAKEVKPVEELAKISGPVQSSIDMDFISYATGGKKEKILDSIPKPTRCDFWIDYELEYGIIPWEKHMKAAKEKYRQYQYELCLDILRKI